MGPSDRTRLRLTGGPVGEATLGPPPLMHRASAAGNPTDAARPTTSSTARTSRAAWSRSASRIGVLTFEASAFKGREPDEDRLDLDLGVPDSWAARVSFTSGAWSGQVSGGHLRQPEPNEPFDVDEIHGIDGVSPARVGRRPQRDRGGRTQSGVLRQQGRAARRGRVAAIGACGARARGVRGEEHPHRRRTASAGLHASAHHLTRRRGHPGLCAHAGPHACGTIQPGRRRDHARRAPQPARQLRRAAVFSARVPALDGQADKAKPGSRFLRPSWETMPRLGFFISPASRRARLWKSAACR